MKSTARDASRSRTVRPLPTEKTSITLKLEVTDPEVAGELRKREGEDQEQFALSALRIGVLALRSASGQVDTGVIHNAGLKLIADLSEAVSERGTEQLRQLAQSLETYFDPATGEVSQKLDHLLKRGSALEEKLGQQVGAESTRVAEQLERLAEKESALEARLGEKVGAQSSQLSQLEARLGEKVGAQSSQLSQLEARLGKQVSAQASALAQLEARLGEQVGAQSARLSELISRHLGEGSVLAGVLSREDAEALKAHVEGVVQSAVTAQRTEILREFSLDTPESALSRLLEKLQTSQQAISDQLSHDSEGSAVSRLLKLVENTREKVDQGLALDDEQSALGRLKRELGATLASVEQRNTAFQLEAREFFASLKSRQSGGQREPKGSVEEQLTSLVAAEAQKCGDLFDRLGARNGCERFVTQLGPDSASPGTKILWVAANERGPSVAKALEDLDEAKKQHGALCGVFVFTRQSAPPEVPPFSRFGSDVVVVWEPTDTETDVYVRAALSVARALVVRAGRRTESMAKAFGVIDEATRSIARQLCHLNDVKKFAESIQGQSTKIIEKVNGARNELDVELKVLDQQLLTLKTLQRSI